jgi:hypothetical protein
MRRLVGLLTVVCALWSLPAQAQLLCTHYVDPDWVGALNGTASEPWTSLTAAAWATLDTALASGDAYVCFSAREAGSDVNQTATDRIEALRTDSSTNRVTLDGNDAYNTDDGSPSWLAYSGSSRFDVTAVDAFTSNNNNSPWPARNYVTVRGFQFRAINQKQMVLGNMSNLIVEDILAETLAGATQGPGIFISTGAVGDSTEYPTYIIVRDSTFSRSYGEGIYVAGTTDNPPGNGDAQAMDNVLIENNIVVDPGLRGGQGDCIDTKDGHTNLRLVGNHCTWPSGSDACDCQGIALGSGSLVEGNYIEHPDHQGILLGEAWDNSFGRAGIDIRNNVLIDINGDNGTRIGIRIGGSTTTDPWSDVTVRNNTIFSTVGGCIVIDANNTNVIVENNIMEGCGAIALNASTGTVGSHDYNVYFNIGVSSCTRIDGANTACTSITSSEANSVHADPVFVDDITTPYVDTNFSIQTSSAAKDVGLTQASFSTDYNGDARPNGPAWDIGAFEFDGGAPPAATTLFRLRFAPE